MKLSIAILIAVIAASLTAITSAQDTGISQFQASIKKMLAKQQEQFAGLEAQVEGMKGNAEATHKLVQSATRVVEAQQRAQLELGSLVADFEAIAAEQTEHRAKIESIISVLREMNDDASKENVKAFNDWPLSIATWHTAGMDLPTCQRLYQAHRQAAKAMAKKYPQAGFEVPPETFWTYKNSRG